MHDVTRLLQALVAPAIFISAAGLLILSLNVRLMGMVSRLRQYLHNKHAAIRKDRPAEAEAYASQISSIQRRAELIRKAFLFTLLSVVGTIASCLLLGLGLYWPYAQLLAAFALVIAILSMLLGMVYYALEVNVAFSSVRKEAADSRFMNLGDDVRPKEEPDSSFQ